MKILFRTGHSYSLEKDLLHGRRRYVGFVVPKYEEHTGTKRKRGTQGLMPGDVISVIGKLPSRSPGLVFEVEIQRAQRTEYKLIAVRSVKNCDVTRRVLRQIFKYRLKDIFKSYAKTIATVKCPLTLQTIDESKLRGNGKTVLKNMFDDSLNFEDRLGYFRLFPLTPYKLLKKFRDPDSLKNKRLHERLNSIYEELKRAPHEILFAKSQIEHFGESFACPEPRRAYEVLTNGTSAPSAKVLAAASIEREIALQMQNSANTCVQRSNFEESALQWGIHKGYFKEVGELRKGKRHYVGLATAWEHAQSICQFLRNKRVSVHHGMPEAYAAVPNAETLAALLSSGGRGTLLQNYTEQQDKVLTVAFAHLLRVQDFAKFVGLERDFEEVRFYGSLVAKVPRSQSNGRLFHDLGTRFGPMQGLAQKGEILRYSDINEVSGQLLVVTRQQQREVEKSIGLGEDVYKTGQKVQHKEGRVRVLQRCWREDRHGRENKRYGSIQSGTPDKCFFRFAGERKKRPFKELYDYHHADVALIHTVQKGGARGVVACDAMSKRDEQYAREIFKTLYVPDNYGSYANREENHQTILACLI